MHYLIDERLRACEEAEIRSANTPFVAILTPEEWAEGRDAYDMGIEFDPDLSTSLDTQAETNYDAVTGTIFIPDRANPDLPEARFTFALDEKGVVFVDAQDNALTLVEQIAENRRWRRPGLERFLADFFVQIIKNDPQLLRDYEDELDGMEHAIMAGSPGSAAHRINEMRSELRDLDDHYDHLMDLVRLLEENENGFFAEENLRYFRTVYGRLDKLRDQASSLRDQALQMRDLSKMRLDIQQNHIMTVLTVVTVIFAPLTLIVGWYGMNFTHMPELAWRWGYPLVFLVSLTVTLGLIFFFKRRKWL
ncbi:CorA family divalent cation transporter [Schaalia cardiffensis]|uniref:magnesium transporter CorA family protein n=1 Tax=Schaalia cardiffensis TaxID=181487 RepID=UPI0023F4EC27|nr:CorA family divalent cation transporter [Schaalia cardiffensis]